MMPVIVVDDVAPLRRFYTSLLGFHETIYRPSDGGGFAAFSYNSFPVGFATQGALVGLPSGPTTNLMVAFEVPDVSTVHRVMSDRAADVVTELLEAPWGVYFEVTDPAGVVVRFVEVTE